jgi:predicted DNA-binding protein
MPKLSATSTSQIKVTLPEQLYTYLKSRADKFGLTLSAYVKNLIIDDVKDMDMPTFKMSEKREKIALKALEDYKKGKTREIANIDECLNNL